MRAEPFLQHGQPLCVKNEKEEGMTLAGEDACISGNVRRLRERKMKNESLSLMLEHLR